MINFKILALLLYLCSTVVTAQPLLVKKQQFEIANFHTFNGSQIKQVKVGWESYGQLNADKSNVILITHYFTGNSHAAGKYSADDAKPGYWDGIIGPGKAIDTNRFFVLSVDTLVNAAVHDPKVITTGPASINPDSGKPYGLDFPVVTIRDFVNVQKALLDSLGIKQLYAVVGASMGSFQAIDWAAAYPNKVARVISVIGALQADAWTTAALEQWANPIRLDPNWHAGNYYQDKAPLDGLTASLMLITQQALHPQYFNGVNPQHSPLEAKPLQDIHSNFKVVEWLKSAAAARAKLMDANHVLYLVRACQLFLAGMDNNLHTGLAKIQAKTLFLPATNDLLLLPYMAKQGFKGLKQQGKHSEYAEIDADMGHLDGIANIGQQAERIRVFLAK